MEYFKDYYVGKKYIGSCKCNKDRDVMGYYGRKEDVTKEIVYLSNNKMIKAGTKVITELQILCNKK